MMPEPARRLRYELRVVDGPRLMTVLAFRTMEEVLKAAPEADERVLSIWAVSEAAPDDRLVAVRNRGDGEWTVIETPGARIRKQHSRLLGANGSTMMEPWTPLPTLR